MFRKIISQLSLSPATIEQVARYAKTVQQKQRLYGTAAVLLAITSVFYALTLILHPSYNPAPTANDLISGGAPSIDTILSAYDTNIGNFRDTVDLLNITRENLEAVSPSDACQSPAADLHYVTGRVAYGNHVQSHIFPGEQPVYIYSTPKADHLSGWCGADREGNQFIIIKADGNIAFTSLPETPPASTDISQSLTTENAHTEPGETVTWKLSTTNTSNYPITKDLQFDFGDIAEYAEYITADFNGIVSSQNHRILWPSVEILPGQSIDMTVTATTKHPIDETSRQRHNPHAYDCTMTAWFGNESRTNVDCPLPKQVEQVLYTLPPVNNLLSLSIFIGLSLLSLAAYLSMRLHAKELRIIRMQLNTGGGSL